MRNEISYTVYYKFIGTILVPNKSIKTLVETMFVRYKNERRRKVKDIETTQLTNYVIAR